MTDTATPRKPPPKPPNNWVGVGLLSAWLALGVTIAAAPPAGWLGPAVFAFVMLGWILAVMAHEFAHAFVAYLAGDRTVKAKGYLAFDPRRYGDLGVSLVLPLVVLAIGGIGFPGGAVYLRADLMRSRLWRSAASLAGPAATFFVLLILALGLHVWERIGTSSALFPALSVLAFLQATALILNLMPVPGLDGFNAIRPWLPRRWSKTLRKIEGVAMLALLLLIFVTPAAGQQLFDAAADLGAALGLDIDAVRAGWALFHFWRPA